MNSFFDIEQRAAGYVRLLTDKRETPLRYTRAGEPFALLLRLRLSLIHIYSSKPD